MKKFCSKCGHQLDLSKRSCLECHTFNPFFISGFKNTESQVVEAVTQPVADNRKNESSEKEVTEQLLKNELLKVKEEAELYKRETLDIVKVVQKELLDLERENKLLKEKVDSLDVIRYEDKTDQAKSPDILSPPRKSGGSKGILIISAVILLVVATAISYFLFHKNGANVEGANNGPLHTTPSTAIVTTAQTKSSISTDSIKQHRLLAAANPVAVKPSLSVPPAVFVKPASSHFSLTTSKVTADLVGKKLSGCDITINNAAEIQHIDNLVLVDKLSATYLKYKCTLKIKQGSGSFTAIPYIYYSAEGTFIKMDGTNCE